MVFPLIYHVFPNVPEGHTISFQHIIMIADSFSKNFMPSQCFSVVDMLQGFLACCWKINFVYQQCNGQQWQPLHKCNHILYGHLCGCKEPICDGKHAARAHKSRRSPRTTATEQTALLQHLDCFGQLESAWLQGGNTHHWWPMSAAAGTHHPADIGRI